MERKGCIFYRSFYESIKELEPQDQVEIYNAIFEYQFENKEVELNGIAKSIFTLILPQLEANNTKYENGCKGGRPKNNLDKTKIKPKNNLDETETKRKEKEKEKNKDKDKNKNNIKEKIIKEKYYENKDILVNKIKEWLEYKEQRKDKKYTEIGFNKLLKQIENNVNKYGEQQVIDLIDECMSNNYQGIIFDKLKNKKEEIKKYSDEWWEKI